MQGILGNLGGGVTAFTRREWWGIRRNATWCRLKSEWKKLDVHALVDTCQDVVISVFLYII